MIIQQLRMQIRFRRDSTANWTLNKDVVPAPGEPCFDLDLGTLKIGDGVKTYEQLEAIGTGTTIGADNKSIVLSNDIVKLAGFDTAAIGAYPRKAANGELEWIIPSTEEVDNLKAKVTTLENKMDGTGTGSVDAKITAKINEFATKVSDDGVVNSYKELIDYVAAHGAEAATMTAELASLRGLVGTDSVSTQISNAIQGIEAGAQVNVIESIKMGSTLLDVINKQVTIPIASDRLGVVKSASGENQVAVNTDGVMEVNAINVNKLTQTLGDELNIGGGTSA